MKEYVKILVVDDEAIMRNLLLKILEKEGYPVTVVSSAQEDHSGRDAARSVDWCQKIPAPSAFWPNAGRAPGGGAIRGPG